MLQRSWVNVFLAVSVLCLCCEYRSSSEPKPALSWSKHHMWLQWMTAGCIGSSMALYCVAQLYVQLQRWSVSSAVFFLPSATAAVELGTVSLSARFYRFLVYDPRMRGLAHDSPQPVMRGDQKQVLFYPISMTHSFAESTRLVSMLVAVVTEPSWMWVPQELACFACNVLLRSSSVTELLSRVLPSCCWWMVAPGVGTLLHNEVRWCFGYPRFVTLTALAVSNVILHGPWQWPLFGMHGTLLVLAAVLLEVVEDVIIASDVLTCSTWRRRAALFYRRIEPLSPRQGVAFTRDEWLPSGPAIGFSGLRFMSCAAVFATIAPACAFTYHMLCLLLGPGFIHGVCSTWPGERESWAADFSWGSPLRC